MPDNGMSLMEETSQSSLVKRGANIELILDDSKRKSEMERLAWNGLKTKLSERTKECRKCYGSGEKDNGDSCQACQGIGHIKIEADMKAIEMVLSPKFPKVSISAVATFEGMTVEEISDYINNS